MPNCGCATPDEAFLGLEDDEDEDEETKAALRKCAQET